MKTRLTGYVFYLCYTLGGTPLLTSCGLCSNEIKQEVYSPDHKRKAVIFVRDCGATTAASLQLSIMDADETPDDTKGNIVIAGGDFEIHAVWISNTRLNILLPGESGAIIKKEFKWDDVFITYGKSEAVAKSRSVLSYLHSFPLNKLDLINLPLTPSAWTDLLNSGKSAGWFVEKNDSLTSTLFLHEANYTDVIFHLFTPTSDSSYTLAVVQKSRSESELTLWHFSKQNWEKELFSLPFITEYADTSAYFAPELSSIDLAYYLDYEFRSDTIITTLNTERWKTALADALNFADTVTLDNRDYVAFSNLIVCPDQNPGVVRVINPWYRSESEITAYVVQVVPDEPEPLSFGCPEYISIHCSSELSPQGASTFIAGNLLDESFATAWVEGIHNEDDYLQESISFTITGQVVIGEQWLIVNGYAKNKYTWKNNNRVQRLRCFVNDEPVAQITLQDSDQLQSFSISPWWKNPRLFNIGDVIRFEILEIYEGDKYKTDTAISLFMPEGNCG